MDLCFVKLRFILSVSFEVYGALLALARPQDGWQRQLDAVEALVSGWKPKVFPKLAVQRCGNRLSELICLQRPCSDVSHQVLSRAGVSISEAI